MPKCTIAMAALMVIVGFRTVRGDESKVPLAELPRGSVEAAKAMFPGAEITGSAKETEADKTVFEITLKLKGRTIDVTVDTEGKIQVVEKEIAENDLPPAVLQALRAKYPGAKYHIVEEVDAMKDGKPTLDFFEVLLATTKGQKTEVQVTPSGKIKAEEIKRPGDE